MTADHPGSPSMDAGEMQTRIDRARQAQRLERSRKGGLVKNREYCAECEAELEDGACPFCSRFDAVMDA